MQALTVRGPFHGPTGHDHHVREFVREFHRQGVTVELIDFPGWSPRRLPPESIDPWFETLCSQCDSRTVLHFCMPHQAERVPGKNNVNFTMFEATRVPAAWVARNRKHELVIVPTESSRQAWIASGMPAHQIRLCPLGINPEIFNGRSAPLPLGQPYRTRILQVAELSPRKNLAGLLEAWGRATSRSDDAVLILKLGCSAPKLLTRFRQQIESMREAAPILLVNETFSDMQMPALYAAATHYISMSFGEGWDLAMMAAGASGLKLIAPDHSAYREYLDPSVATMLPSREVPIVYNGDAATGALFKDASWWEPDQDAAIAAIRQAIDGRDAETGRARERILQNYTWEQATKRLIGILAELESLRAKIANFKRVR